MRHEQNAATCAALLKTEQFATGHDVFVSFPTGYGTLLFSLHRHIRVGGTFVFLSSSVRD